METHDVMWDDDDICHPVMILDNDGQLVPADEALSEYYLD